MKKRREDPRAFAAGAGIKLRASCWHGRGGEVVRDVISLRWRGRGVQLCLSPQGERSCCAVWQRSCTNGVNCPRVGSLFSRITPLLSRLAGSTPGAKKTQISGEKDGLIATHANLPSTVIPRRPSGTDSRPLPLVSACEA